MEILKKFASRKFIAAAASFAVSIAAIIWGGDNEWIRIIGAVGVILAPSVYIFMEGWIDGKAVAPEEYIPTVADSIYQLVELYEEKYGEDGITTFIQDLAVLVKTHFTEPAIIEIPVTPEV